jgi:superoxide dismutase
MNIFVFVFVDEKGRPIIIHSDNIKRVKNVPRLAVDISEHAYFLDYRFEREKYLRSAIANLNLSLLDN